jgi:transcriptional regulator with XRE-family HTH domain
MITYRGVLVNVLSFWYPSLEGKEVNVQALGTRLQQTRKRKVLSQEELAAAAGVPVVTISRIENGHAANPRPSTVRKLAAALGVEPGWLLFGDEVSDTGKAAA